MPNDNGSYDVTISGALTNGRSDTIDRVEVWYGYNGGDGNTGAGSAFTQSDPMATGTDSSWASYLYNQTSPVENPVINTITYDDDSNGSNCSPYPFGNRT